LRYLHQQLVAGDSRAFSYSSSISMAAFMEQINALTQMLGSVDKRMAFMDDQHQIAKEKKQS
jgi:hypothetical protein